MKLYHSIKEKILPTGEITRTILELLQCGISLPPVMAKVLVLL
jgi:hypothetical protein